MNILEYFISKEFLLSLLVILLLILLNRVSKKIFNNKLKKLENNPKTVLYINLIKHSLKYICILLACLIILNINGVNVTSIFASIGVVSIIIGLALQDALKDYIMGFNILFDNFFKIGDVIKMDNIEGVVENFNLKTTKIRDINTDNLYIISNRNIDKILNVSDRLDIDIPLTYEDNIDDIERVLNIIIDKSKNDKRIKSIKYIGINEFSSSSIMYKLRINCDKECKNDVKRYINNIIKRVLDEEKITIPYTQIDIHTK